MADGTDPVSLEEQRRQAADRLFAQEMADEDQRKAFRQQSWDMTQPPPDQAGEALQLGNKFGVPRKAVEADPDYWKRRDQEARRKLLMEASPRTMAWLDDEDNYAVAKDDVDILSQIESTFSKIGYAAKGGFQRFAAVGVAGERQAMGETMEFYRQRDEWEARQERRKKLGQDAPRGWRTVRVPDVGTISGFDIPISYGNLDTAPVASGIVREEVRKALPESMRPMFASQVGIDDAKAVRGVLERRMATVDARARAKVEEFTETLEKAQTGNYVADGLLSGVTSLTEMAPSMAAFFALRGRGGATVASGAMGVQVAGAEYLEGIYNLNLSERDASDRALLQAGVEIVTERISLGYLDELLKSDRGFVSKLALSMGQEQIQEQFATLGNRLVDIPYVDQDMTIGRFVEETPYYAGQTALATLVASGITNTTLIGLDTAVRDMVERSLLSQPSAGDAAIDAVLKKAKESRLGKRSPEKLKDVLDRQAAGTGVETVTVDLDELAQALKEKGVELSDALDGLGVPRDELQQKWENFGEIEVKLSDLATSDLMRLHGAETQANTRRNDDPYTPARKEKMRAALEPEMQETAKRIYDDLQNGADIAEKEQQVADRVRQRIRGAGILAEREQENASVAIQTAMVTTLARRVGADPVEFYDQHYPRIQGSIDGMVAEEGALVSESRTDAFVSQSGTDIDLTGGYNRLSRGPVEVEYVVHPGGRLEIESMYVEPEARGKGEASRALDDILAVADKQGLTVDLTVDSLDDGGLSDPDLKKFYERRGFVTKSDGAMVRQPKAPDSDQKQAVKRAMEEGALEQGSLEPGPAPMMLTRGMRLGGPDIIQPDETTGFITSAEQAFNRPAGRFEKAKALTEEQWIKYFQIAGTTKEAMERQVYPALAELAGPDNDRSEITREQMREALMGNRVNVEFASERDYSAYVADGRYSGYEQEVIVLPDEAEGYQSHNWQTDGVVAHIRYTQRRGADGKNILHVEELQSDLHQEAAKQGYRNKNSEKYARLRQEEDAAVESYQETVSAFAAQNGLTMRQANQMAEEQSIPGIALLWKDWESATKARQDFEKEFGTPTNIPDAPMKDWESALIRRALQKAASIGVEVVTFPKFETLNGALQNAGTRKFYDERLPATIARVAKQLGLKVEQVGVSITDKDFQALDARIRRLEKQLLIGKAKDAPPKNEQAIQTELSQLFKQRETALSAADNKHIGIRLTPEASARLAAGNVLFQTLDQQRRGQFSPSRNIITMFEAADVTTLMHEGAHWYLAEIERMASAEGAHPFVVEQWEAVKTWGKVGPDFRMYDDMGRVTEEGRELQEAFAETFEVYLQTGKAPVPSLREAFRAFKQWITDIWSRIRKGQIILPERANLSPDIVRVMDRMLAVDEEIESQTAEVVTKAEAMANDLYERGIITKRQRDAAIMNLEQAREAAKEDLMAQIMQAELRVREAQMSAEQRRIEGDVVREYDISPVGRARSWLGYGQWKGDVPVSETAARDAADMEMYQRGQIVSEAQAVAAREFDDEAARLIEDSEFRYEMLDEELAKLTADVQAKLTALEDRDTVQMAEDARAAFYDPRAEALDPDSETYDADLEALEAEADRVEQEALERAQDEATVEELRLMEEMDALTDRESQRLEMDAEAQIEAYRKQAITELVDRFEAAYGAAALLDTSYPDYMEYDQRERIVLGADGVPRSIEAILNDDSLGQSIRTATRMPMEDIYAWVVNNVDSKIQQFSSGDEGTMMSWRLSDAPDAPRVLLSIRLSRKGRADVNLFLNNKMADALDEISDPVERSRIATEMFSQAIMVMRQYSAETPDLKAFNFIAAENEKAGRKAKSREELYRFMLSTMRMDGYTAYEIGSQTSVVRQTDGVKSADPLFDGAGFVMIRDGVDVDEFARNEILRGSQSGGDAGEVVTALTAVRLSRPARGGVDRGRLEAGRADPRGAVDDTLGQEARKVDTSVAGGLTEKSFIRTRDLEGATIFPMFADLTDAGSTFAALDGLPIAPTPYLGGPNFPWLKSYRDAGIVWAFNAPGVITKVRNKVRALQEQARAEGRSDRVVITMLAMKDDAHTSNEMTISALLRTLDAVVAAGRFPQEQLAEAKELIVSKANKKDEGYSELATFPGFGDAQALHDWIRGATFTGRKALASEMRSAKFQQLPGMFPVERIVREAIDPDYRATQQGDALLAFEIDPDAEDLIIDFENKDQAGDVPRHPAYRYGMRGTLVGSFSTHIPMEVLYADLLPAVVGRAAPSANPKFLMERLKTSDAQVVTEDIVREAEVIEGLHDYRIAQAHTAGIAGQWRSSDVAANKGGVNPVEFERALLENEAAATLPPYTRTDVTKGKKDGSLRVFQLGEARVQDGGLNVWMAVKTGYDYRNEYPGEVTDALVEQGILTDNEVALVGVASNELGVKGMATFQVLKGIEEGVTVLDAFKVTSPSKPDGLLPTIYATLGFEEVGQIPFDPKYYDAQQLADLKAIWTRQGWSEADGYPAVAIMKWRGDDAVRPEATRRFILESQAGLGIRGGTDVDGLRTARRRVSDSPRPSDQGNGLPGQGDGRADPRRFADRARGVSSTVRSYVENILAADARAIKALKLPQELIDRIRAEYGPALEQTPDDTLGQEAAPTFYSALGRFIASSNTARAPAAQWKGMISNAPGVKAEEVEWSGVMDWLDASEGPVTREALAAFVEANGVRVEEVVKSSGNALELEALREEGQRLLLPLIEERDRAQERYDDEESDPEGPDFGALAKYEREIESLTRQIGEIESLYGFNDQPADDTKWSSWTLPGGENYREMLLTLPERADQKRQRSDFLLEQNKYGEWQVRYTPLDQKHILRATTEEAAQREAEITIADLMTRTEKRFTSSHWSEPNVLAHVRFKERTGPNGERVLALEEVQSDWHQAGRERGYKGSEPLNFEGWYAGNGIELFGMPFEIMPAKSQEMARIRYERYRAEFGNTAVPNAPFKNNAWANLVLKRMIRYAAENGFDAVAWIPGNVQNGQIVEDTGDNRGDFYDKIVPNLASKLGKKYGARVTDMVMEGAAPPAKSEYFVEGDEEDGYTVQDANNRRTVADGFRYEEDAFAWIGENEPSPDVTFHSLPLTPELATAAMTEGFPLFQRGDPKGWGETAPPPDLPPMRLDLEAVRELYGEDAVRRLPKPIRDRSRDKTSIDGMMDIIRANVKTLKRKPPMTLFQYIRSRKARTVAGQTVPIKKWGIKGAADELKAMNREDLINETNGIHIDYVRESAAEAGYLPENATLNDFLNAIDREARGEPVYSRFDQKEVEDQRFAQEWADWLDSQGVDMFEANQKKLKAEIAKIVTSTAADARTPDEIAAKLGFADGETMLNMLALMGNRDQYVKEETDRRMREEFGDPMADGTFEEEARVIAEAEVMSRAAEIEMEALARAVGEPAASKLAKEMAMDSLGLMTVKELEGWERFLNAERREMNNTLEAVKRGDMVQAFIHKRRQLVNMHLARAAREKSIAIEKTRKDLLTYYSSKGRRDKIAPDYLEKIEALLEGYELRVSKQGPGEQKRRMSAKEYVDDMDAQGREDQVAPEARLLAELSDKKVWRTLTADEVDYVAGTVRNIAHLGRTKDKLMRAQEKRRFQAVIGALVDRMNETGKLPGVTRERSPTRTASELAVDVLREGHSWLMRPEHQARSLDGGELGPIWEALFRPMAEAADVETQMMREATRLYREAWSKFSGAERNAMSKRTVSVPELPAIGKRFTQLDIISIALNWGVTYNREVLLEGYGWTADQVEAALFRTMTDKHWDLVESLWAISGMYKAEAFALEKAMTGVEPKAVEGISFTLPSGRKIDGKYYHIQYDANQPGKMSRRQAKDNDAEALTAHRKSRSKAMTKNGGLIERKGSGGRKVKLGLSVFEKAMSETIHDIAFRRAVFDVGRIIADDNFADTYQEVAGMEAYRQLNVWLKDIAMPPMEVLDPIVKAFAHVRRNIPLAVMGYKVGTALIQPTGLLAAMPLVGHRRVLFAVAKAFANPRGSMYATWKQVADMSEFMRDRVAGYERDVRETTTAMTKGGGLDFIRRNAFVFITGIDIAVSVPTWMAAYGKAMDGKVKGIQAGVEEDAIAYADSIIRRTQTAGKTQDLSRFQRGGEFQKQISMIFGYFNNLYSLSAQQTLDMRRGNISRAEWAWHMSVLFVAIPLLAEVFAGRLFPDDEDDEETIEGKIAETVLLNFTGMFPGLRDAVALNVKPEFGYRLSPTSKFIEDIGRTAGLPAQLALDDERELKEADVRRAVNAVGALTGLPSAQINITGNYIIDALQGEEDPTEDPVDAAREALVRNTR